MRGPRPWQFDKDGSGSIDAAELGAISATAGQPLTPEQLAAAVKQMDANGDGTIDRAEFTAWWRGATGGDSVLQKSAVVHPNTGAATAARLIAGSAPRHEKLTA